MHSEPSIYIVTPSGMAHGKRCLFVWEKIQGKIQVVTCKPYIYIYIYPLTGIDHLVYYSYQSISIRLHMKRPNQEDLHPENVHQAKIKVARTRPFGISVGSSELR